MTDRKSRRVVIINNIKSETIDQAIFILKSDKNDNALVLGADGDIAFEAQNIINNYVRQVERLRNGMNADGSRNKRKPAKTRFSIGAVFAVFAGLLSVFCVIGYMTR